MSIWRTQPPSEQPLLTLVRWSVQDVQDALGTCRVLVGFCVENHEARTSSELVSIDPGTLICSTQSGRKYQLQGRPGVDSDAEYVFRRWCAIHQVTSTSDVTSEVWGEHLKFKPAESPTPSTEA